MPNFILEDSQTEEIQIKGIDKAFIIRNAALESLLFNRNLIGLDFTKACESATEAFLRHFEPELSLIIDEGLAELMLLSKGLYYWMHNAFARVFQANLEINFAATRRAAVLGDSADSVLVEIPYLNFDAPAKNLLIGDTVASGATVCSALSAFLEYHEVKRVFLFCIAGGVVGGQTVARFCKSRNIDLTIAYGLAAFGLSSNGFDLSFLHPDTITYDEYRDRARNVFEGKAISAAGWDFGSQAQAIRKYKTLCWIEAEYWDLQDSYVFQHKEKPIDPRLVEKENAAYSGRFPSPQSLMESDELLLVDED